MPVRKKAPTVKQLRARAKFVKMIRARARAAKAAKRAAGVKRPARRTVFGRKPLVKKATARRRNVSAKKTTATVRKNGRKLYGAAALAVLKSRGSKKRATTKRRNAETQSSAHPISVRHYYRSGGPGYASAWKRAESKGQQRLFKMNGAKKNSRKRGTLLSGRKKPNGIFRSAIRSAVSKRLSAPVRFGRRRNSGTPPGIEEMHEKFLGRATKSSYDIIAPAGTPKDVAVLGELTALKTEDEEFHFDKGEAFMGADAKGNLYVLGEVQVEANTSFGEIEEIDYLARKDHLKANPFNWRHRRKARRNPGQLIEYYHEFGEEGGALPKLKSDSDGMLHITGGSYTIEPEGITN